jgi:hypothetical protein
MPVEMLIAAQDLNTSKKGDIIRVKDQPCTWGSLHTLPRYIIVTISNATKNQVDQYIDNWPLEFEHEILAENDQGYRVRVSVDPALVSASDVGKAQMRDEMRQWLVEAHGAVNVSFTSSSLTADLPKPIDLQEVKAQFHDFFSGMFQTHRYHFSDADVDTVINAGGTVTITRQVALTKIVDKLSE